MQDYNFLGQALITMDDIKKEISTESNAVYVLKRLTETNKIKKLKGGLYATVNPLTKDIFANKYEIATALYKDAAVGYHSALEFHGLGNQVYSEVHVISSKRYSLDDIDGLEYVFFNNKYSEGISEYEQNTVIRVTELERTVVDCIDRIDVAGGLEEVFTALSAINYCDEKKLLKHLQYYDKKVLYKKVGYLFSVLKPKYLSEDFYRKCKENISARDDDIREYKTLSSKYIKEWKLIVPEKIVNTEN
ncbi:MAG TPA: hypothetical protein DDW54_01735 [Clostridiales bacterium]|nr:hypothetical protein [Clostridiales bacterium]